MRPVQLRPLGLRARITSVFALGALFLSASLAVATYELTRASLVQERERASVRAAYYDAAAVSQGLSTASTDPTPLLRNLNTGDARRPLLRQQGEWLSITADVGLTAAVPERLLELVDAGSPGVQRVDAAGERRIVVGIPLPDGSAYFEVGSQAELGRTLAVLATVLGLVALTTTLAGAGVGYWASRRALRPLGDVAVAAGSIAAGDLTARVARDGDPDLDALAVAFNTMVDEVQARSEADRRFAADVSHELRSPLQTLTAAASVLARRRDELDGRTGAAVDLLTAELERFEHLVTDLLVLARADRPAERRAVDLVAMTRALVERRSSATLEVSGSAEVLDVDPRRYEQLLVNLLDNAAKHGGGATRVGLCIADDRLELEVDDEGAGVPEDERELVFRRFARGRAANARGGSDGTGLGLALVSQHVMAHRGTVELLDRPGGGARFRVVLPGDPTGTLT